MQIKHVAKGGTGLVISVSVKTAFKKSGNILRVTAIILVVLYLLTNIICLLDGINIPEPKLRDQLKERPLRVEVIKPDTQ